MYLLILFFYFLVLTNIDINAMETPPPSIPPSLRGRTPCRNNSDIFFMATGTGRQRASIAAPIASGAAPFSFIRTRGNSEVVAPSGSFRLPNMLQTTRGTANRYSYAEESITKDTVYSTYDSRVKS